MQEVGETSRWGKIPGYFQGWPGHTEVEGELARHKGQVRKAGLGEVLG